MKSNHKNFVHLVGLYTYYECGNAAHTSLELGHVVFLFSYDFVTGGSKKLRTDLKKSVSPSQIAITSITNACFLKSIRLVSDIHIYNLVTVFLQCPHNFNLQL